MHSVDFTFCGTGKDLDHHMEEWYDVKVRGILGSDPKDDKVISIWGRIVKWGSEGLEYEADPKHRELVL